MSANTPRSFIDALPFSPTPDQATFFEQFNLFIKAPNHCRSVFLLKGYAGTGKTTLVSALVKVLPSLGYQTVLLAPTGRAAKVMAQYAAKPAYTIHKKIYWQKADPHSAGLHFEKQRNKETYTLYIVDEASMISDDAGFDESGLLEDLVSFVFEKGSNKLLLVGDKAQLPPVGQEQSNALNKQYLEQDLGCSVGETELTQVMRQSKASGILENATQLRIELQKPEPKPSLISKPYSDFFRMTGEKLEDGLRYAYQKYGYEDTIVICRSNKTANLYNQHIRRQILNSENEIDAGDILMVVKNNYYCLEKEGKEGFIANGDFAEITKVKAIEEIHGMRFANVHLRFIDFLELGNIETKILLDTLYTTTPALGQTENQAFYQEVMKDYENLKTKKERQAAIKADPYLNALQVKFAYALTCHKAQGGQWKAVFLDHGYLKDEKFSPDFLKWLYTGITRATSEIFLVNFSQQLLGD